MTRYGYLSASLLRRNELIIYQIALMSHILSKKNERQ